MQNPFDYHRPIGEIGQFIGRRGIVSKIYSRIGATRPQSVSIVGDFKIGKTSLLWYLEQQKTKTDYLGDRGDYIFVSIPVTLATAQSLDTFGEYLFSSIHQHVPKNQHRITGERVYDGIKRLIEYFTNQEKKVVMFFDDFNLITQNEAFPLDFFSFMRSLANNYNLAFVTTSYEDLQKLCISKDVEESPFFNIFTNITLKAFEEDEARSVIKMSADSGINLELHKNILLEQAGLFPYPLKMACNLLFDLCRKKKADDINSVFETDFEKRIQEFYTNLWNRFDLTHQEIFKLVVQSRNVPQDQVYLMNELVRRDYIKTRNGKPAVYSPTFKNFVLLKNNLENGSPRKLTRLFRSLWRAITH